MRKIFFIIVAVAITFGCLGAKKVLDHVDFDRWEKVTNYSVSSDGAWVVYAVNPQEGDGVLYFHNTAKGNQIEVKRGYKPSFTADGKWAVALVHPYFGETRKAKILKKKDFDLPQDSLAIIHLATGKVEKIGNVISYRIPEKGGASVAWLSCDTTLIKPKSLKDKKAGRPMVLRNLSSGETKTVNWVSDYVFSKNGVHLAMNLTKVGKDTLATNGTAVIDVRDNTFFLIDRDKAFFGKPVFNEDGSRLAYVASNDSVETGTRKSSLFISDLTKDNHDPREIKVNVADNLFVNQYSVPEFSHNGTRIVVGVAPYVVPDDTTLVSFENPSLDIWRWNAPYTPPQENNMVERLRKKTFPVMVDLASGRQTLVTSNPLSRVTAPHRWDGDWALVADFSNNGIAEQWDYQFPIRLYVKNVTNGEEREVGIVPNEMYGLSPADKFVYWFEDRCYHIFDISSGERRVLGESIEYPLWDEAEDVPLREKEPYGVMGWTENDNRMLVYDKYDVWSLDPMASAAPENLTAGEGRKKNLKIRFVKTDPDFRSFRQKDRVLYSLFDYGTKQNGLASTNFSLKPAAPRIDFLGEYQITQICKALNADVYSWGQGNFSTSPNIYVSRGLVASKTVKVSNSNPQMADYNWGTAQLFKWYAYDGKPSDGVLYLPEDFDDSKEYPMLVYFYETYSEDLFRHYDMEPSWSWINFPFYVSRGYVVFVPDIHYTAGIPGENAYNYVCSGVEEVCKKYPNIDKKRVGIDGQSWGGYQTAYLVTRTDMFACAGSGAPVANMTSAFGGIRWGSGDSRQAQYEVGQSRIGRNLWEAPELYIANSPVFHADRVHTPLLIMHNDADGAVPWYQGIEMFMALRRLGKPVWMLQYNGEAHNLKERRNRKDITKRLQQFFDHYLKGEPMPEWMKNGIPAIRKGQEFGY
jgi:hypothetical protein